MKQYHAEELKLRKLRQFRAKSLPHGVFLHTCSDCKRFSMMLHLENCVLCGATNLFYQADNQTGKQPSEAVVGELINDILLIEDSTV